MAAPQAIGTYVQYTTDPIGFCNIQSMSSNVDIIQQTKGAVGNSIQQLRDTVPLTVSEGDGVWSATATDGSVFYIAAPDVYSAAIYFNQQYGSYTLKGLCSLGTIVKGPG
jgi:hypothetical protein